MAKLMTEHVDFIGRDFEIARMRKISEQQEASIIVVYGRRRVGKTTMIERVFAKRNLIKLEGLQDRDTPHQLQHCLEQLALRTGDSHIEKLQIKDWKAFFILLWEYVKKGTWTLYLEELQWLANYQPDLVSDLKFVWDNYFLKNNRLVLILCGSSPSFMIDEVMRSKALHNRSQHEIPLQEFDLREAAEFMGNNVSREELLDAYLAVGGIPTYLKLLKRESSIRLALCKNAFIPGGFFAEEAERIFVSSLAQNGFYRQTIEYLAKHKFATRAEILKAARIKSGGYVSKIFADLIACGFIGVYAPLNLGSQQRDSRYYICDSYFQFFFKFIEPRLVQIRQGDFRLNPVSALDKNQFAQWLGYSFERFCLRYNRIIAKICGFESVQYDVGPFYVRSQADSAQLDLVFSRADKVRTVCEIKYQTEPVDKGIIKEFKKKLAVLEALGHSSVQHVLIAPAGATATLRNEGFFDRIITRDDLFG